MQVIIQFDLRSKFKIFYKIFIFQGADLKERAKMEESEIGPHVTRTRKIFDDLSKVGVPVIAAMDGAALG